jgi:PAS domain S-box-containing protein
MFRSGNTAAFPDDGSSSNSLILLLQENIRRGWPALCRRFSGELHDSRKDLAALPRGGNGGENPSNSGNCGSDGRLDLASLSIARRVPDEMRHLAPNDSRIAERNREAALEGRPPLRSAEADPRAEAVLATLLESVECGIVLFGPAGDLWAVNDRFAEILGLEPERLRELSHHEQIVQKVAGQLAHGETVAARWRQRFRGGEAFWDELEVAKPEKKIVERYARPVLDPYKRTVAWLEILRDITERRQMESRLLHTERLAALGQMLSGVAHELNNALTSVFGYAQLVRKRARGFEWEAQARHILEEGERARRIARNLLLFARGSKSERAPVNLNEIVERTLEIRAYELRLENISAERDLQEQLPEAMADASQLQQALLNLIVNAEQAIRQIRESGHIWIRTRRLSADRISVEVADDGPGVPPEVILRIFDPFFTTKPPGVGTGLGLSILYGIVHQHGGEVSVEKRPGGGAVFRVELPSVATSPFGSERPYVIHASSEGDRALREKVQASRVLVVEDEPTVAQLIADVLSEEGHLVDTVLDSREGLNLARARRYDLVICDLRMPHLDGRAFYKELVDGESPLQHRLIFVTGDTLAPRTVDFLQKSGAAYLAKPFLVEELKEVVAHALQPTSGIAVNSPDALQTQGTIRQQPGQHYWKRHEA